MECSSVPDEVFAAGSLSIVEGASATEGVPVNESVPVVEGASAAINEGASVGESASVPVGLWALEITNSSGEVILCMLAIASS